jgi:general secretion pathway protein D
MSSLLRPTLAALLAAAPLAAGAAQPEPVRVTLPKGAQPKAATPPSTVSPEDAKKGPNRAALNTRGHFQLDFEKVDIDKLVQTISEMTGKLFILSENIRGKITIIGPEHGKIGVTADEAYAAFLSALDANGLTTYPVGKYIKIVEKRAAKGTNIPTLLEDDEPYTTNEQMVTKVFKLRYVEAEPVRAVIQQLVSRDGDTAAFPPDTIIINDLGLNMHRLARIIERLDAASSSDEIRVIQVQYATASEIAEKLRQVFEEKNRKPGQRVRQAPVRPQPGQPPPRPGAPVPAGVENAPATLSQIIPDDRTNKLVVIANDMAFERILEILKHLDMPIPGEGQVHVYYLSNANAEELATTLASLTQGISKGPRPPAPPGSKAPNTVADLFSGEVKITADKGTNSLVIIANNSDYRNLVNVIEKLDHPRRQVFIEAVIMEVNLSNAEKLGLSFHGGKTLNAQSQDDTLLVIGSEQVLSSISGITGLATQGGFLAGLQGPSLTIGNFSIPSFSIVLQALQNSTDTNILSTPHLLATDNEDAEITVGQNVPFQAGITSPLLNNLTGANTGTALAASSLLGGTSGLIAPIQRQNVELKLKIKPQINDGDFIRMQIEEQIEEIASRDATLGPTTSKRTAKTTVVSRDQNTVVLGGLIQERVLESVQKTPILGDIPVLGRLFRYTTTDKTRLNLLLFLTPYIIRDQTDFQKIFERKMKERQEFVEQFLGRQPGYEVPIDYTRKAGPLAKMFKTLDVEAQKVENGGPGVPGQRAIVPKGDSPFALPESGASPQPATSATTAALSPPSPPALGPPEEPSAAARAEMPAGPLRPAAGAPEIREPAASALEAR